VSESDLLARFRSLAEERLRHLNQGLLELEQGTGNEATLDGVMREIHTLKGESRMLGLLAVNRVAHRAEDLLQHARKTQAFRDAGLLEVAYAGLDLLGGYLQEDERRISSADEPRAQAFETRAAALLAERGAAPLRGPAATARPEGGEAAPAEGGDAPPAEETPTAPAEGSGREPASVVRVTGAVVDELTRTAGVLGLLQARIERTADAASALHERAAEAVREAASDAAVSAGLDRFRALTAELGGELRSLRESCFTASLRHQRLRDSVSSLRLATVAGLFGRFPRMVRDVGRELHKEARVEIRGGDVGIDQRVLDALADPVVHLVRNAVDHGLEPPDLRASLGKPRHGTILLSAAQAGRFVEIRVSDDGRGIDPKAVGDAAVRKGLLSESDVARMSKEELYEQLCRPAFSTKAEVTDLSGRGVGLDVVKRVVEGLGGGLRIQSEVGSGTEFILRVPVSSALVDALVVQAGRAVIAVPAAYVERVLMAAPKELEPTGTGHTLVLPGGDRVLVVDLAALVGASDAALRPEGPVPVVLVVEGERRLGLRVDRFLGERSLVQEALDPFLQGLRGATGTAMLEDGGLATILNVVHVLAWAREDRGAAVRPPTRVAATLPLALVAEDSELTRSLVVAALRRAGMEVVESVDGRDALARMRAVKPALLVTDLEMPVMDGIELIRQVRADPALADTPILVFTTRDQADSKREAADAGADAYIVKSEFEEEALLRGVDELRTKGRRSAS
jgi:two-component system chemotaxis sensor kinase CheA